MMGTVSILATKGVTTWSQPILIPAALGTNIKEFAYQEKEEVCHSMFNRQRRLVDKTSSGSNVFW
jgi:hypothetical protein